MGRHFWIASLAVAAGCAGSGEVIAEWGWTESMAGQACDAAKLVEETGRKSIGRALAVESRSPDGLTCTLLKIEDPGVFETTYALVGLVRTRDVEGEGYLEMWSHFPGRGPFFSRGLESGGPAGHLGDSEDWRTFVLPFRVVDRPETDRPTRLVLNVVLPGRGEVLLGPVRLVEYSDGSDPVVAESGAWFPGWAGGAVGGALGALLGILGAVSGGLAGRGRGRRFVLGAFTTVIGLGLALAALGLIALLSGQPWGVYYTLLLTGGILAVVSAGVLPVVRKRFREMELRRMRARDA